MTVNFCGVVMYDGSRFAGWQKNKNTGEKRTLQGIFEELLEEQFEKPVQVRAAGRTDAGVNAGGQVVQFRASWKGEDKELLVLLQKKLEEKLYGQEKEAFVLRELFKVPERFHCRFDAAEKTYDYYIDERERESVFARAYAYPAGMKLDLEAMQRAADLLEGRHDFRAFSSVTEEEKDTLRTIRSICVERIRHRKPDCHLIRISITADGFLYHMVRILSGTLLEVGKGERLPESIPSLFEEGKRCLTGVLLPPNALFLREVKYKVNPAFSKT